MFLYSCFCFVWFCWVPLFLREQSDIFPGWPWILLWNQGWPELLIPAPPPKCWDYRLSLPCLVAEFIKLHSHHTIKTKPMFFLWYQTQYWHFNSKAIWNVTFKLFLYSYFSIFYSTYLFSKESGIINSTSASNCTFAFYHVLNMP